MIPYSTQGITERDIAAVERSAALRLADAGPGGAALRGAGRGTCTRSAHAVAVSSATAALHLACLALGVGPGVALWTSPNSFVASANCARYCGADVDFVDIDARTGYDVAWTTCASELVAAERVGRLPQVVVPVHFAGQPCDLATIARAGATATAFGSSRMRRTRSARSYRGEPIGSAIRRHHRLQLPSGEDHHDG